MYLYLYLYSICTVQSAHPALCPALPGPALPYAVLEPGVPYHTRKHRVICTHGMPWSGTVFCGMVWYGMESSS